MSPTRKSASDSLNEKATVRIETVDSHPLIWREVEVSTSVTLKVLHDIIQVAMVWFDDHVWELTVGGKRFGLPMDEVWARNRASRPAGFACAMC